MASAGAVSAFASPSMSSSQTVQDVEVCRPCVAAGPRIACMRGCWPRQAGQGKWSSCVWEVRRFGVQHDKLCVLRQGRFLGVHWALQPLAWACGAMEAGAESAFWDWHLQGAETAVRACPASIPHKLAPVSAAAGAGAPVELLQPGLGSAGAGGL